MVDNLYPIDESRHVLCSELYSQLLANFPGGIIIANQGEGASLSSGHRNGERYTSFTHSGEYYRANCPFCRDARHRLWVNHMYGQPDHNGRAMRFLATCYNEDCLSDYANRMAFNQVIFGFRNANERRQRYFHVEQGEWIDPSVMGVAEVPGTVIPMGQLSRSIPDHEAVRYMCGERRYTSHMLDHYEVSYCTYAPKFPEAAGRIIFPIRMRGQFVGWQARYIGTTDWKVTPKYYGMPGMRKRVMLYNYDNAKAAPFVVLVEGVTDCHVVGDTCCAILGKNLSRYQLDLVVQTWGGKPIILILDPDAREEMRSAVNDLREARQIVVEIILPEGYDCGDYDRRTLWNIIHLQARNMGVILPQIA